MKKGEVYNGYTIFLLVVSLLSIGLNMINGRFHPGDFKVYYTAAANLLSGGKVYLESFYSDSGFYKYSPATLFFFMPFTLFGYPVASVLQFVIQVSACWYAFVILRRIILRYMVPFKLKHDQVLLSVSFGCILIHFARETYLGNINLVLLMLSCRAILDFLEGKEARGGILFGIAVLLKPYLLILALSLVLRRKWRSLAWMCLTGAAGLVLPFLYPGPRAGLGLYRDWLTTLVHHGEGFPGRTSLDYFLGHCFPGWPAWGAAAILLCCGILASWFILANIRREKTQPFTVAGDFAFEWFLLFALLPNLIRTDWVVLLFAAPLITMMVFSIAAEKKYRLIPVFAVLIFFYGANSDDLLGRELSHSILESGLMGMANFLLVLMALLVFSARRKTAEN